MTIELDATLELAYSMCLADDGGNEVVQRNIAGRLYYGIFHIARDAAGIVSSGVGSHQDLIDYFEVRNPEVANRLIWLRRLRNRSDYVLGSSVTWKDVRTARKQCEIIQKVLGNL